MLQYLIILLDETSTSYCHYDNQCKERKTISLETLRKGIRFAMKENLMIQFVYPGHELSDEIKSEIETIDHSKIVSASNIERKADVVVCDWSCLPEDADIPVVLRTSIKDFLEKYEGLYDILAKLPRTNIVFTDVENFSDSKIDEYKTALDGLAKRLEKIYAEGKSPQFNLLTDRMMLKEMNNCGAGDTNITLAPDGMFYICPAFYHEGLEAIGDMERGTMIPNQQLYKLDHAPLCRNCDAYQCKRCVWLNQKLTLEVNTPSRQQCIMAHLERNTARELLNKIRKHGTFLPEMEEIKEIDYLEPFEKSDNF